MGKRHFSGTARLSRLAAGGAALFGLVVAAVVVGASAPTNAQEATTAVVRVTGDADDGSGVCGPLPDGVPGCSTLRAAVSVANSASEPTTVEIGSGTYELTQGPLVITGANTRLVGAGEPVSFAGGLVVAGDATLIDANGAGQGIVVDAANVSISGVAITGAAGARKSGGGIVVRRNVNGFVLSDSTIVDNRGDEGAGVAIDRNASGLIERSTFVGNAATNKGGGLRVDGTVDVVNSTFTDNTAQSGGAISVAGTAAISYSTFVDNTSNNSKGGGVDRDGGDLAITGSILTQAQQSGSDGSDCSGTPDLIGVNYVGNDQGCNPGPETLTRAAVGSLAIEPLADNGGPTQTIEQLTQPRRRHHRPHRVSPGHLGRVDRLVLHHRPRSAGRDPTGDRVRHRGRVRPRCLRTRTARTGDRPQRRQRDTGRGCSHHPRLQHPGCRLVDADPVRQLARGEPAQRVPDQCSAPQRIPVERLPVERIPVERLPTQRILHRGGPAQRVPAERFSAERFPVNGFSLSDLVLLDEGGWSELLTGTEFEGVPLQSITLGDVQDLERVKDVSFEQLNLQGTPLNGFPITAFLLGAVPLNGFPLNGFARWHGRAVSRSGRRRSLSSSRPSLPAIHPPCTDDRVTLASIALAGNRSSRSTSPLRPSTGSSSKRSRSTDSPSTDSH